MRYPNSTKTFHKVISHANRGMILEELINEANKYYFDNDIALIFKKPTPIGIVNVKTEGSKKTITKAYFKEPSTLDYNGVYKGRYIEFDAKETKSKTSFPIANISNNQLQHLKKVINHNGIAFLIISMNKKYYLLKAENILKFISEESRKSIPLLFIEKNGFVINSKGLIKINYIEKLDKIIGGCQNEITKIS